MKQLLAVLAFGMFLFTGSAHAAGSSDAPAATDLAEMLAARDHIKAERYKDAIPQLQRVVAQQPQNADAWNLLAYSQRKMDDLTASLENYKKALSIDPSHKDAYEYLGELYLRMGNLAKAEKQLKRLDSLCSFGCDQIDELKAAIAAYKKKKG
ncbi:MAG: tetratricopeptide repeat protein [Alphaproteobacteria bacterium]